MRVLSIERSGQGGKFKLVFDDGSELVLRKEVLVDYGLRRNDELSSEKICDIRDSEIYTEAYISAVRLLNYRMRTEKELQDRLKRKGFPQPTIARVINKLVELGLLDDLRFAEAFVSSKTGSKPLGRRELERRLREKGLTKELASTAVSGVNSDEKQLQLALEAARTRMRSLSGLDAKKKRERLAGFLSRRGFDWGTISKALREILNGENDAIDL